jgi:CubicO group peptidase (beta-lactamase class C family)
MSRVLLPVLLAACSGSSGGHVAVPPHPVASEQPDPDGPHREAIAAQVKPFVDSELVRGIVVGIYDAGKREIYGFGEGVGGKPPDGRTLFELGSVTSVYTGLLFADAIQRREVDLDTPLSELVPPGVTVPTRDKQAITLHQLALHSSGLPRLPPTIAKNAASLDPFGGYTEDALYRDLIHTELVAVPGVQISYSNYGAGVLGFVLGRKIGGGFASALDKRILAPLELKDTYVIVPPAARPRVITGTTDDLAPAPPWTYDALAGAGALMSTARDQLSLIDLELDAAEGGTRPLRRAMKLTQEPQLDHAGENEGLGWMIDSAGHYWHNGGTGGFHAFMSFDPKTRRGVVILTSTANALVDRLAENLYRVLDGDPVEPARFPSHDQLAPYAGSYDFSGTQIAIVVEGKRVYIEGPGEPRHRLVPLTDHEFWSEALQTVAVFESENGQVARVVFGIGDRHITATRVP